MDKLKEIVSQLEMALSAMKEMMPSEATSPDEEEASVDEATSDEQEGGGKEMGKALLMRSMKGL